MGRKDKAKRAAATKKPTKSGTSKSSANSKGDELDIEDNDNESGGPSPSPSPAVEDSENNNELNEEKSKGDADSADEKSEKSVKFAEEEKEKASSTTKGKDEKADEDTPSSDMKVFPRMSTKERAKYDADHRLVTGVLESQRFALDVKIGGFSLIFHGKELVKDTSLEFTIGRRYGLIGSNGSGKSQLLHCIAAREVPVPDHIDIYLLEEEAEPSDMTAIQYVIDEAKKEVLRLEKEVERAADEDPEGDLITDIYNRLDEMDPDTFEARAGKLLHGLGFSTEMMGKQTKDMSGGWRMRVALAKALFVKPTLLLLDEPTNHLDLEAVVWLENYLANYNRCLVIISHSQDFLNHVCTHVMHLTPKKTLLVYTGNYDQFIKTKSEQEVNQMKKFSKEQADIAHIKTIVAKAGTYKNTVRQAKSREKVIEKMEAKGLTEQVMTTSTFTFRFPPCERLPPPVLQLENLSFAYSGLMKDALYTNVNLGVDLDSRIAIVGQNGTGKSTLLKLMLAELTPTEGLVKKHIHLSVARYNQHSNDILDPNLSTLDFIRREFGQDGKTNEQEWRGLIGKYGISGNLQNVSIGKLSDGYKTRIVMCMMALKKPQLLLLDEPTNHLDMESIDGLAEAINNFEGGTVLVSHDFRLIDQVAKTIWVVGDKNIKTWKGNIRSYKQSLIDKMKKEEMEEAKKDKAASWKTVKI